MFIKLYVIIDPTHHYFKIQAIHLKKSREGKEGDWREEREGRNAVIIISKSNKIIS